MLFLFLFLAAVQVPLSTAMLFGPSLFCFSVIGQRQADLLSNLFLEGIGLFGCDEYMLFSSLPAEELFKNSMSAHPTWPTSGPVVHLLSHSVDMPLSMAAVREVWHRVSEDGRYKRFNWILKMDPETVFHPDRLRDILSLHCSHSDCDAMALQNGEVIPGAMQALTKAAVAKLAKNQLDDCEDEAADSADAEVQCLQKSLHKSDVKLVKEPSLFKDFSTSHSMRICTLSLGSFWPFLAWPDYMTCMGQAGYSVQPDAPSNPSQVSWTRDVLQQGYYVRPTMFCWVLVQHKGEEPELLKWQRQRDLGIFACDGWMIVSNASAREVLPAEAWHTHISIIHGNTTGGRTFRTVHGKLISEPADAGVYAKAWEAVFEEGSYRSFDWVLKLDVGVVVVPERLRSALNALCQPSACGSKIVHNFGGDLLGPVEAMSAKAASTMAAGMHTCTTAAKWEMQPEYRWLSSCVSTLGIGAVRSALLLSDHKALPRPCDTVHGCFSPFMNLGYHALCLKQSGYYYIAPPPTTTLTRTSTSTSVTSTSATFTTSTVSTTTVTSTVPKVAPMSIFAFEGRSFQKKLPVWVITAENEQRGIPFALEIGAALLAMIAIPSLGCMLCRRSAAPAATSRDEPQDTAEALLTGPAGQAGGV
ncbi:DNAJB8 [Symbiodinium natans]|uniref:DNAJB8 protein n=1 Tax=Symbiodinium natans TaxID=878477 RepID=A0A812JRP4_9DINO|nr:DNAJB8 [Symbiodinium natans]